MLLAGCRYLTILLPLTLLANVAGLLLGAAAKGVTTNSVNPAHAVGEAAVLQHLNDIMHYQQARADMRS